VKDHECVYDDWENESVGVWLPEMVRDFNKHSVRVADEVVVSDVNVNDNDCVNDIVFDIR
jgi:hypothetical protein